MDLHVTATLAAAGSVGGHLQAAGACLVAAVWCVWMGRRQQRTGRGVFVPDETLRVGEVLVEPPAPTRGKRVAGRVWAGVGWFFVLPFVVQAGLAVWQVAV
ncbi:hypothetical protein ABZ766_27215 [Streptomyces sp. NPDC006670]|uniref:hypothetical protein n=1 Tax=Streptomyces sp. NPDC006670 TaxID=3154476 RepID=UPI0033FBE197